MNEEMKRKHEEQAARDDEQGNKNNKAYPYFSDRKLLARVEQYLRDHKHVKKINVGTMATQLQKYYSEYRRRKKNPFLLVVRKAYDCVNDELRTQTLEHDHLVKRKKDDDDSDSDSSSNACSDDNSFSEDDDKYANYQDTNSMNNTLSDLYRKTPTKPNSDDADSKPAFFIDRTGSNDVLSNPPVSLVQNKERDTVVGRSRSTRMPTSTDSPTTTNINTNTITSTCISSSATDSEKLDSPPVAIIKGSEKLDTPQLTIKDWKEGVPSLNNVPPKMKDGNTGVPSINSPPLTKKSVERKEISRRRNRREGEEVKKKKTETVAQKSTVTFADVGGNEQTLMEVCKLLIHMKHPEVYNKLGVTPPRGFLLHGPPGCGKSLLAQAIAGELDLPLMKIAATEIVSGVSGESEEKLRDLFTLAAATAPCVLFLDEIDAITPKRENASKDMERRIVSQLLTCMDDINNNCDAHVLVIGATNRPDSLDPALRRAGRFDREICLGIPNKAARERILRVLCRGLRLTETMDYDKLASNTPGFVGADLNSLTREAAMTAVNRILKTGSPENQDEAAHIAESSRTEDLVSTNSTHSPLLKSTESDCSSDNLSSVVSVMSWLKDKPPLTDKQLDELYITMDDFMSAVKHVQPSAKREGFATIPGVTWSDIGALSNVRDELQLAILAPVRHAVQFASLGLTNPPGILLAGPPGCGKTLLAKAIANESGINFISVKGPELLNMYVGESERAVRQVFQRARNSAPCVIFFDELDSLCPRRSLSAESGSGARVVNQLLTEMDGLEERKQVFIMGATNRPDIIDPAVLRPGRLDKVLYVGLPSEQDRVDILKTITKNGSKPLLKDVNLEEIGHDTRCEGYTGADLAALVREASVTALKFYISDLSDQNNDRSTHNIDNKPEFSQSIPDMSGSPKPCESSHIHNVSCSNYEKSIVSPPNISLSSSHVEPKSSDRDTKIYVTSHHFNVAFTKVKPSVSAKDRLFYAKMHERMAISNSI